MAQVRSWRHTGSPPRTRGAPERAQILDSGPGITPTYAGSTPSRAARRTPRQDHPRVRGEHTMPSARPNLMTGSPPRTRGALRAGSVGVAALGITPAYAGSTRRRMSTVMSTPDHPRVRGEHLTDIGPDLEDLGSPPRTRGARFLTWGAKDQLVDFPSLGTSRSRLSPSVRTDAVRVNPGRRTCASARGRPLWSRSATT